LINPSPKFPTSKSPPAAPQPAGAMAIPHGEFNGPFENEPFHQIAIEIEYVDKSVSRARYIVVPCGVLFGVGHVQLPAQILNVKGRKSDR